MKKTFFSLALLGILASCNGPQNNQEDQTNTEEAQQVSEEVPEMPLLSRPADHSKPLLLEGFIDKYPIQMELNDHDWEKGLASGKYNYEGKTEHLVLDAKLLPPCIRLDEHPVGSDESTGMFLLQTNGDSVTGMWLAGDRKLNVRLHITAGDRAFLSAKGPRDEGKGTSAALTGSYKNEQYFLSENPENAIVYNGGRLMLKTIGSDSLEFLFDAICGPTYHFAAGAGVAHLEDEQFVWRNDEGCEIIIEPHEKGIHISANSTFDCGFGARAYLSHDFVKVDDVPDFEIKIGM